MTLSYPVSIEKVFSIYGTEKLDQMKKPLSIAISQASRELNEQKAHLRDLVEQTKELTQKTDVSPILESLQQKLADIQTRIAVCRQDREKIQSGLAEIEEALIAENRRNFGSLTKSANVRAIEARIADVQKEIRQVGFRAEGLIAEKTNLQLSVSSYASFEKDREDKQAKMRDNDKSLRLQTAVVAKLEHTLLSMTEEFSNFNSKMVQQYRDEALVFLQKWLVDNQKHAHGFLSRFRAQYISAKNNVCDMINDFDTLLPHQKTTLIEKIVPVMISEFSNIEKEVYDSEIYSIKMVGVATEQFGAGAEINESVIPSKTVSETFLQLVQEFTDGFFK